MGSNDNNSRIRRLRRAVAEMIQRAFEQMGGQGDAGAVVLGRASVKRRKQSQYTT